MTGLGAATGVAINKASKPNYGNFSNRFEYGLATAGNCALASLETTAAVAGTSLAGYGAIKSKGFQKALAAIPDVAAKTFYKIFRSRGVKTAVDKFLKLSPKYKALGVVGSLAALVGTSIIARRSHKQGKLDQKYQDRAQLTNIVDVIK